MCSLYSFNDALTNKAISFYPPPSFFFLIYFLTERKLLYNVVLVSAIWQHESAIIIHIFPSLRNFPPIPHPTPLGHHRESDWVPCVIWQPPTNYLFYTWQCIYVNSTFSIHPTLSFPHCVHKAIHYICNSIPSLQIVSSVPFFQILYICINIWYLFFSFWLTSLYMRL